MSGKIAIIEDDIQIRQMYRIKFEASDYEVETAENGVLGLELLKVFKPDLVLLDLMMPGMNGEQMLKKLRSTSFGKDMKVIILTNLGIEEVSTELKKDLGVLSYIVKADMTPRQVVELVKKYL